MAIALTMYGTFSLILMFECVCNKSKKITNGIDTKREWISNISHCMLLQFTFKLCDTASISSDMSGKSEN